MLLEPAEDVIVSITSFYARSAWYAIPGYLTLTNARLVFTGERFLLFVRTPAFIPYREIGAVSLEKRLHLGVFIGSLAPAIVVKTARQEHVFWPAVLDKRGLVARIEKLRRGSQ